MTLHALRKAHRARSVFYRIHRSHLPNLPCKVETGQARLALPCSHSGHASFLGPSRTPTQKARAAQKEQPGSQPGNANASKHCKQRRFVAGVACVRAPEGPKTNGKKARTAQRANQPQQKQNGQNNSPTLSVAVFDSIYGVL